MADRALWGTSELAITLTVILTEIHFSYFSLSFSDKC